MFGGKFFPFPRPPVNYYWNIYISLLEYIRLEALLEYIFQLSAFRTARWADTNISMGFSGGYY